MRVFGGTGATADRRMYDVDVSPDAPSGRLFFFFAPFLDLVKAPAA